MIADDRSGYGACSSQERSSRGIAGAILSPGFHSRPRMPALLRKLRTASVSSAEVLLVSTHLRLRLRSVAE
jgi:hypothetical protein